MHKGIDVSNFQGLPDFELTEKAGYRFSYIKASEGTSYVDPHCQVRQQLAARHFHTGFYHFLRPREGRNGASEADHFWRTVKGAAAGKGQSKRLLRLAADIEATSLNDAGTREYTRDFLTRLTDLADHKPILYTFPSFLPFWGSELGEYALWIANYDVQSPRLPSPWDDWVMWQYTSKGKVPGVAGFCDVNKCPILGELMLERDSY